MKDTSKNFLRLAGLGALVIFLPGAGIVAFAALGEDFVSYLRDQGIWLAPLLAITGGILIGLALLPSHIISLAAGFLFGLPAGILVAIASVAIGALAGTSLAKRVTALELRQLLEKSPTGRTLANRMLGRDIRSTFVAVTLARLPPQVPFALGNLLAASLGIRRGPFLAGTILGMAPRVTLVVWLGSELQNWNPQAAPPSGLILALATTLAGFGGLAIYAAWLLRKKQPSANLRA